MQETPRMCCRQFTEALERDTLSPYAKLSADTAGRKTPLPLCEIRTEFQRDRDRILHCKSFRRLKHKTQVFLSPQGDHYRTRLTHTLEVSQIARTISRALRLNEDLTEAIALGHDLGHTPFGHAGEDVLDRLVPGGFEHNRQSLRVAQTLERDGEGLNLTAEVRDGILNHKKTGNPETLEGRVVSIADRIAYLNHDIDDAVRAGVLRFSDIPAKVIGVLGRTHGDRINTMILDVVHSSFFQSAVMMSGEIQEAFDALRDFMFDRVYYNADAKREEQKAKHVVEALFYHCRDHIVDLPGEYRANLQADGPDQVAADWIACMTDRYAIAEYRRLYVPEEWTDLIR